MANGKRLIWGDIAEEHLRKLAARYKGSFSGEAFERAAQEIAELPTVDADEVVLCAKCKWWDTDSEYCQFWHGVRHPGHYCGEGDRKDNG